MRIFINLSVIQEGGGLQAAHSFVQELTRVHEHLYYIAVSSNVADLVKNTVFPSNFILGKVYPSPSEIVGGYKSRKLIKRMEAEFNADVVFTLFGPPYWCPKAIHVCGYALAQHLYTDSPYFDQLSIKDKLILYLKKKVKFYSFRNHCDFWITETSDTALRLSEKLHVSRSHIFTVSNTYNGVFDRPKEWKQPASRVKTSKGFRLVTISSFYPHKNLQIIPLVVSYLRSVYPHFDFTFVLTIAASAFSDLTTDQKKHILFLGKVNIDECPLLYKECDVLFMPTLLECFTASYVEAMKMGIPILTSDLSFARDICGDAAVYFDPIHIADIAEKVVSLANNSLLRKELARRGSLRLEHFPTPRDRAHAYLDILTKIHKP